MTNVPITIVIPTTCRRERADLLRNAIASIHRAAPGAVEVIVAMNGPHVDPEMAAELQERPDIRVVRFAEGSSPMAIWRALELVESEFFGVLDDDDEMLPRGLTMRLEALYAEPRADLVLSNGFRNTAGRDELYLRHLDRVVHDPLRAFFVENWLPSCGALFRRSRIERTLFENYHPLAEWSWLAFRIAMAGKKILALQEPTFRVRADTPESASKSHAYVLSYVGLYERMLAMNPRPDVRAILRRRLSQAHHDASVQWMKLHETSFAWHHHARSLVTPYGWRFFWYVRHILRSAWQRGV